MTVHYRHDGQAACACTVRPPRLTGEGRDRRLRELPADPCYLAMAGLPPVRPPLPPVRDGAAAHPADVPLLRAWAERLAG